MNVSGVVTVYVLLSRPVLYLFLLSLFLCLSACSPLPIPFPSYLLNPNLLDWS